MRHATQPRICGGIKKFARRRLEFCVILLMERLGNILISYIPIFQLHFYFKGIGGPVDPTKAKTTPPPNMGSKDDWEYLCDMWCEPKYMETAEKRVMACGKRKMNNRNGSKSTIRYHIERGLDLDSSTSQIETWRLTHWDDKKGWRSTDAAVKYEEMMKLRNEHTVESMSDNSILEKVLGRSSVRLSGWGRDPVVISNTTGTNKNSNHPTYDELVDDTQNLKRRCAIMERLLIEKNIMPPPSSTSPRLSEGDTSDFDTSTHSGHGQSHGEY
ncbi:uncharacterized protein LOC111906175 [Lactuca sativa]|uniref:Uncharacterized protein n=1 Tax=Lactuca sativa TaxID=4236 RepID=A0A9R1V4S8_LACSA|nr:uncharacterized protein LOC111906175 [Lactuca sativa]XP_052621368.1 uncharacterized protein LOC111906175 [Lactuca sativa]KAJ0198255.1 hypothetical protein LSAT_V11C700357510 [Lactuca sativa]